MFQSTHPRGVRLWGFFCLNYFQNGFNPRTHAGCDALKADDVAALHVVSIHAPTRGATRLNKFRNRHRDSFNPRTHAGCARYPIYAWGLFIRVSIHAPTRGATPSLPLTQRMDHSFNPRTHAGCDNSQGRPFKSDLGFNPRTHAGCDPPWPQPTAFSGIISIHAPTRGATLLHPGM